MRLLTSLKNGIRSLLSDHPKSMSIKRWISAMFAISILYMVWYFLNKVVPAENQDTFKHLFDGLCLMIVLLTGAATIKDIIALKNGTSKPIDNANQPQP